jgi:hypothetical protein
VAKVNINDTTKYEDVVAKLRKVEARLKGQGQNLAHFSTQAIPIRKDGRKGITRTNVRNSSPGRRRSARTILGRKVLELRVTTTTRATIWPRQPIIGQNSLAMSLGCGRYHIRRKRS